MLEKIRELMDAIRQLYRDWKPHIVKLWKGYGYYISLACLLVLFGIAAYLYRENNAEDIAYTASKPVSDIPVMAMTYSTVEPTPTPQPTPYSPTFLMPVEGNIVTEFNTDELVWNETLGQWHLHNGIDIAAGSGTVVAASESGTVSAAYVDDLYGNVIEITHEDGWLTRYCGVETLQLVENGMSVQRGSIISAVGNTALIESAIGAHVHFEAIHNGEQIQVEFK